MIRISCSKLEDVKQNPEVFAQQLLLDKKMAGGSFGMFQCWQTKVRATHKGEMDPQEAIKSLRQEFRDRDYADNAANKNKKKNLIDKLIPYLEEFKNKN